MKNLHLLLGTIIGTLIMIIGIGWLFGKSGQSEVSGDVTANRVAAESNPVHVKGDPATAPVVVVEFSDFQCPACRAAQPLVQSLLGKYQKNEVTLVFRHMPLQSIHPNATAAAIAANAAAKQGKFWELHDLLFERQDEWANIANGNDLNAKFSEYVTELGMNGEEFSTALADPSLLVQVQDDVAIATQLGVNATPTFFVNGQAVSAPDLASTIQTLLASTPAQDASPAAELESSTSGEAVTN